jgi:hypothetical protein
MADDLRLPPNLAQARDPAYIERVKLMLELPDDAGLELLQMSRDSSGELLEYVYNQPIVLRGPEYGAADGVTIEEPTLVRLRFDDRDRLVSSQVDIRNTRHLQLVQDQIRKLSAADMISPAAKGMGEPESARETQPRPWYVELDSRGRKHLKRAYIEKAVTRTE